MPNRTPESLLIVVARLFLPLIALVGILAVGSHWRVANPEHFYYELSSLNFFYNLHNLWPWVPNLFNVVLKDRVSSIDAIVNLVSLLSLLLTINLYTATFLLSGFVNIFLGILSFSLEKILWGILAIATGLFIFAVPVLVWFTGFLHSMTISYLLIWAFVGLPCLIGGYWVNTRVLTKSYIAILTRG
jgi:hypothetical protein